MVHSGHDMFPTLIDQEADSLAPNDKLSYDPDIKPILSIDSPNSFTSFARATKSMLICSSVHRGGLAP